VFVAVAAVALGYGIARLHASVPAGRQIRVALVAVSQPGGRIDVDTADSRQMLHEYVARVGDLARSGAQVVVLPEAVFAADGYTLAAITDPFAQLAAQTGATIVVGAAVASPTATAARAGTTRPRSSPAPARSASTANST
jgi:apolipoprotein N-acyltransferase